MTTTTIDAVDFLKQFVAIPSLCGQEDQAAEYLRHSMEELRFEVRRDEVGNVVGVTGDVAASRSIVVLGHMDTVPGMIPVAIEDGKLVGRGSVDAKGPLAAAIMAASRASGESKLRIVVVGAVQEEGPSVGARHFAQSAPPDYLIIAEPSGWDAVVLGYKGSQRFTVRVALPESHTAGSEPTASERVVDFWNELVEWAARQSKDATGEFDRLTPTLIAMKSRNDGLIDRAEMRIGLRLPLGVELDHLRSEVQNLCFDAQFDFADGEPAVRGGKSNPLVSAFLRSIRQAGGAPRFKVKTGTSDMNVVGPAWGCPMAAYGPGDSRLDHTPNEHVSIDEYQRAIDVLTYVFLGLS